MSNLDYNILKELDRHTIDGKIIGIIMNNIKYVNDKNKFLYYLINNRNIKLNKFQIIEFIKSEIINKSEMVYFFEGSKIMYNNKIKKEDLCL